MSIKYLLYLSLSFFIISASCERMPDAQSKEDAPEAPVAGEISTYEADEAKPEEIGVAEGDNFMTEILKKDIPSPRKQMTGTVDGTKVIINYGSPSVRGRTIWGDLEPYDEVWRTGADEATTIEFEDNVMIEGKMLSAGRYSLFTIPSREEWTIIFNSKPDQFGDYSYDENDDTLRVRVKPMETEEPTEQMAFVVDGNKIVLKWDRLAVPFTVEAA